ncbi:MAG TPA: carbonic anhydrase [Rhodopila sp.]
MLNENTASRSICLPTCNVCTPNLARRSLLTGLAAASILPRAFAADAPAAPAPNAISGEAALHRLMAGNARHAADQPDRRDFNAGRVARAKAQYPIATVLGCADSRVGPEFVFDQGPGELFVVRVAGNVLTEEGTASLEYAAQDLGVPLILVLGHSSCGAVAAAIKSAEDTTKLPGHLPELIAKITPAVTATQSAPPSSRLSDAIAENVRLTKQQITASAPVLSAMVVSGKVKVAGGVYDLATGKVRLL